jgi:hypothetical protein
MTPDQIQQLVNQQMAIGIAATPIWMKAMVGLQILSMLVTVVCLPLIVWKLFSTKAQSTTNPASPAEIARLQQIRERREFLANRSTPPPPAATPSEPDLSASGASVQPDPNDDSRFLPPSA